MSDEGNHHDQTFEMDKLDYEQTTTYFRSLHETRFRLLQFLPIFTGVSLLSSANFSNKFEIVFGLLGIVVIFGITIYDQRNNMIYDRLTKRAAFLEKKMGFSLLPTDSIVGGPFASRPGRRKLLGITLIWHDFGLALIYSFSFGAWLYIFLDGVTHKYQLVPIWRIGPSVIFTIGYFILYLYLVRLNDRDDETIQKSLKASESLLRSQSK